MMALGPPVDVDAWLADQARDALAEGAVGLYEFVWWLQSSRFPLHPVLVRHVARESVRRMVADGAADLYRIAWPTYQIRAGPLPASVLDQDDAWHEGAEFIALVDRADPSRTEPTRTDPSRAEPTRSEPRRPEPRRLDPLGPVGDGDIGQLEF
jgi:hypothetical protein